MIGSASKLQFAFVAALGVGIVVFAGCMKNATAVNSSVGKDTQSIPASAAQQGGSQLATARNGPAAGKSDERLQVVALFPGPEQPVGVAVSKEGRIFHSFPRWGDPVKNTVTEFRNGQLLPFPDALTNAFDGNHLDQYPPDKHLVSVQAIAFDSTDRLWLLDPGSINFAPSILHAPKLWAYDISTRRRVKSITFPNDVAMKSTYLNDVRFDLNRGREGSAYITDSGAGGIIVVDIASGKSWRHLDRHPSVQTTPDLVLKSEGEPLMRRSANGEVMAPDFRSDGIALSPDGKTLYYTTVGSHDVYSVSTDLLADSDPASEPKAMAGVRKVASKSSGNDGIICDSQGRIYTTDFEEGAIRRLNPNNGAVETIVQDARLLWPDTLAIHGDQLYVTSNQLARQPNFHFGKDERKPPYALFRIQIDGQSKVAAR